MLRQEMFDKVSAHLLTQNKKSGDYNEYNGFVCMYRSSSGNMCAIGALIPDSLYDPDMEGKAIHSILTDYNTKYFDKMRQIFTDSDLASMLQFIHDACQADDWYQELYKLAVRENLDTTELKRVYNKLREEA